jgi:hypothetical protein
MGKHLPGSLQLAHHFRLALWRQARYLIERDGESDPLRQQPLRRRYLFAICEEDACRVPGVGIARHER